MIQTQEVKQYKFVIRFPDGELDGKPRDQAYGFAVAAMTEAEARATLTDHLEKCVAELKKDVGEN